MSQSAADSSPSARPLRRGAHWTIYLPSLVVALTWAGVYFWAIWQEPPLAAIRSIALAIESVVVPLLLVHAFLRGKRAAANPWGDGATTLEWSLPSPPPFHSFDELPRVT